MATNGSDQIVGGFGNDVISGLDGDDAIFGMGGNDTLNGNDDDDFLKGGEGDDLLFGGAGNDTLVSGEREPALVPPPIPTGFLVLDRPDGGDDNLSGGSGNDLLIVTTDSDDVSINGGTGVDTLQIGFSNADVRDLINDFFDEDVQSATARIDLAAGNGRYLFVDTFSGYGTLVDLTLTIALVENVNGSAFHEFISGTAAANVINGNDGDDTLQGRGGADTLNGGLGRDRAIYDNSTAIDIDLNRATQLGGEAQGDILISIADIDGSRFADVIRGNFSSASNNLFGNFGNDILEGRGGADILNGGGDRDRAIYDFSAAIDIDLNRASQLGGDAEGDTLISIEDIDGSRFADVIRGNSASNRLNGQSGNDTLEGREGNDTLLGGSGNDVLDGGRGNDILDGEGGFDTVLVNTGSVITLGQNGADGSVINFLETDTLRSIENVTGSIFTDSIFGNEQANNLNGGNGNDTLRGGENNDVLDGGLGNDILDGEGGIDTVLVNTGSVITLGQNGADGSVINFLETDTLRSIENVIGSIFTDSIVGNEQANNLDGGSGDDNFTDSRGNDRYFGGAGLDTLDFISETNAVSVNFLTGFVTHVGSAEVDTVNSIERVVGSQFADEFVTSSQNDLVFGAGGDDSYVFIGNNLGNDRFSDSGGNDTAVFDFRDRQSLCRLSDRECARLCHQ